ncbi:MAG: thioesterase [Peptococcaceae bacterium]|nr:thioesterase [Peptococcaceae bacterium]
MLTQICKSSYTVESYMVDFRNKLKLSMLLGLEQETAFKHAADIFVHYSNPAADNGFWVIAQSWTSVERLPEFKEQIEVETWIRSVSRVISRRNFRVSDAAGNVVAQTSMDWAVLESAKRFPRRLDLWGLDEYILRDEQASLIEDRRMRKVPELMPIYLKTVRYSDIDINNHANNTRYVDWMLDSFDLDFLSHKEISHVHLSFKKECTMGDQINIFRGAHGNDDYYLEGRFADSDAVAFQAEMAFV